MSIKITFSALLLSCCSLIFNACSPIYIPPAVNAPNFSNSKELKIAAQFGTSVINTQSAYALTDNIGIMANCNFRPGKINAENTRYLRFYFIEGGVGFFHAVKNMFRADVYTGYGRGKYRIKNTYKNVFDIETTDSSDINVERYFVQPSVGLVTDNVGFSFATRFSYLNIIKGWSSATPYSFRNNRILFIDPTLTLKAGGKRMKFIVQAGVSLPTEEINYFYQPLLLTIGLQYNTGYRNKYRKSDTSE